MQSIKVQGTTKDILTDPFSLHRMESSTTNENDLNTVANILRIRAREASRQQVLIWDEGTWDDTVWG